MLTVWNFDNQVKHDIEGLSVSFSCFAVNEVNNRCSRGTTAKPGLVLQVEATHTFLICFPSKAQLPLVGLVLTDQHRGAALAFAIENLNWQL